MNSSNFRVRRATLDDISHLAALWNSMKLPADALSKRVTEFQIAENPEGVLVGAVGLEIAQKHGRIHSEAFTDFAFADHLRPMLWERIHAVATNHGLLRLWTQEHAPFWSHCGLVKPDPDAFQKLPAPWQAQKTEWLTLKLKGSWIRRSNAPPAPFSTRKSLSSLPPLSLSRCSSSSWRALS